MNSRPSIDHTILSPSGRVSKRARKATLDREMQRLFPPGFWDKPEKGDAEKIEDERQRLLRSAANLRELADRGMKPRAFRREAEKLEAEATLLSA